MIKRKTAAVSNDELKQTENEVVYHSKQNQLSGIPGLDSSKPIVSSVPIEPNGISTHNIQELAGIMQRYDIASIEWGDLKMLRAPKLEVSTTQNPVDQFAELRKMQPHEQDAFLRLNPLG
jgi:hypothetical protein